MRCDHGGQATADITCYCVKPLPFCDLIRHVSVNQLCVRELYSLYNIGYDIHMHTTANAFMRHRYFISRRSFTRRSAFTKHFAMIAVTNLLLAACSGSGEDATSPNNGTTDPTVEASAELNSLQTTNNNNNNNNNNNQQNTPPEQDREVRTYDGSENNQINPDWGATFSHLQRIAPAAYADGVSTLAGELRTNVRTISNTLALQAEDETLPNTFGTSDFAWQWGQFLDHDINLTDGSDFESADISVPAGDLWFDPTATGDAVIPFNRALFDPETGTDFSNPREQENEISSWIDGSMIYGSDTVRLAELRVGPTSPFLKTSDGNLLPFNVNGLNNANGVVSDPGSLFLAGDVRANEQVGLAAMHTLFVRDHNRLAAQIQQDQPQLTGQEVFEATRRLVVAKLQIITYNEHLPALMGPDPLPPYNGYQPSVNGTIFNEFSAAAYRLGHSMVNDNILRLNADGSAIDAGHLSLRAAFFTAPSVLTSEHDIDPILRGLAAQRHQKVDLQIVDTLRNFLFGQPGSGGFDLTALNIQRGRDHGLSSYNDTREAVGLSRYSTFSDITSDTESVANLADVYTSVDDIDLWIGGLAEDPVSGSQLGPLFQEILIRQFTALRDGDRFWYQNYLTDDELEQVRGTTLADVIRNNTDIGAELQDNVFFVGN